MTYYQTFPDPAPDYRALAVQLFEALEEVIVIDGAGDRRCKLCGYIVSLHPHRHEVCPVAAALDAARKVLG